MKRERQIVKVGSCSLLGFGSVFSVQYSVFSVQYSVFSVQFIVNREKYLVVLKHLSNYLGSRFWVLGSRFL